jgi:hypothetical protein
MFVLVNLVTIKEIQDMTNYNNRKILTSLLSMLRFERENNLIVNASLYDKYINLEILTSKHNFNVINCCSVN